MKRLTVNGRLYTDDDGNPVDAARIERIDGTVVGYGSEGGELFSLRGVDPAADLAVVDETGADVRFDLSGVDEFRSAVEAAVAGEPAGSPLRKLADALLGTSGPGAEARQTRGT